MRAFSAALAVLFSLVFAVSASAVPIVGLTTTNHLVTFDSSAPGAVLGDVPVGGLQPGENLLAIDYRPVNKVLYGLGSTSTLYTLDPATGAATVVGTAGSLGLSGTSFGLDISPFADRVREVSDQEQNQRFNPDTAALFTDALLNYAAGDPNNGANPNVVASAYTNSVPGATATTLFGIDSGLNLLVRQGGADGAPPSANTGQLFTIGPLGFDPGDAIGFDIAPVTNTAFAAMAIAGDPVAQLFTVDLTSGAVNLLGAIGGGAYVHGIAVAPTSLRFTLSEYQGTENQDATVVVARDGISQGQVTVNYATAGGTAGSGEDFTPTSGTLTWADGDVSEKAIQVPLGADDSNEGDETFTVALSAPTGGAVVGAPATASVKIVDVPDNAAPALKLSGKRKQKLRTALKKGVRFGATTNEACALRADALIPKKLAKRLGLKKRRVGRRRATLTVGKRSLRVKPTKKARRKLRRQRRVKVTLKARCADAAGNRGTAVRTVTLRR